MNAIVVAKPTAPVPFQENWAGRDWSAVQAAFHMEEPCPEEILLACYEHDSCEGSAYVLYRNGADYFYASGSHCSCFGLEDQWDPERYDLATLIGAIERGGGGIYGFCGDEGPALLPTLRTRLRRKLARERKQARLAA